MTDTQEIQRWIDPVDNVELTDPAGAAIILACSRRTVFRYMAAGQLEIRRMPNGKALVTLRSLFAPDVDTVGVRLPTGLEMPAGGDGLNGGSSA